MVQAPGGESSDLMIWGVINPGQGNEQLIPIYQQNPGEFDCSRYTFTTYRVSGGNVVMCLAGASAKTSGGGGGYIPPESNAQLVASAPFQSKETDGNTYWRITFAVPSQTGASREKGSHWRLSKGGEVVMPQVSPAVNPDGSLMLDGGPMMYADAEQLTLEEVTN